MIADVKIRSSVAKVKLVLVSLPSSSFSISIKRKKSASKKQANKELIKLNLSWHHGTDLEHRVNVVF